jgi:hypothetical protein
MMPKFTGFPSLQTVWCTAVLFDEDPFLSTSTVLCGSLRAGDVFVHTHSWFREWHALAASKGPARRFSQGHTPDGCDCADRFNICYPTFAITRATDRWVRVQHPRTGEWVDLDRTLMSCWKASVFR